MPRIRYLKPDFFTDEDLASLSLYHRLAFAGLWCYADKKGRLEYRPMYFKAMIFPYEAVDMEQILKDLSITKSNGGTFLEIYSVNDRTFIQITGWEKHQRPHHTEKDSIIPPPFILLKEKEKGMEKQLKASEELSNGEITVKPKKKKKVFIKPTVKEVISYFNENGYTSEAATKAWTYYEEGDPPWTDSNKKPVSSWKQKMRGNWFRDSYKKAGSSPTRHTATPEEIENALR